MASKSSISHSTIASVAKQRVQEELKKISTTKIESRDLQKLREEIIPPKTPLTKQKEIVTEKAEKHELDLGTKFTSLDLLQDTIKGLEDEVSRLMEESNQAQAELKRKRQKMQDGLMDLLRLQKLIEQINSEMNEKTSEFNSKMAEMEKKRLEIMEDPNLTEDQKLELLKKVEEEVTELKRTHESALTLLQNEKEKLKDEARTEAKVLQKAFHDLEKDHLNELQELENAKVGASPSEVLRIEEQIFEKKKQFEQKKHVMEKSASSRKYFFDDEGRFYLDENGEKVYKLQGTTSSEMEVDSKGNLRSKFEVKIKHEVESEVDLKEKLQRSSEINPDRRIHKLKTGFMKLLKQDELIKAVDQRILKDPNQASLKIEKETLKDEARIEAQILQTIFHDLEVEHIEVLQEVEKLNLGVPTSDLLKMVEHYSKVRKYFFDENGIRFYLDKNGQRVFGDVSPLESATSVASKILLGAQDECNRSRKKLKCGLLKLLKLQKLIEQIDKEICEEVARSKSRSRTPKEDCRQVENKRKVLTQLDKKLSTLKDVNCKAQKLKQNVKEVDQKVRASSSKSQSRPSTARTSRPCSKQETRTCALTCLQSKKEKLKDEARIEAQIIQAALHELKEKKKNICKELENLNIGPSPAELMKLVKETVAANKYFFDERGRFYFNQKGCRIYKQDSCTSSFMNCGACSDPSSFDFSGISEDFCFEPAQNPDIDYLKQTVGPALRCGLANMTMTNPPDPINYLANYLLQFRCNEIRSQRQKAEVEEILKLRREIFCEKKQENSAKTVKCPGIARKTSEFK
ncbi:myosin-11-like [Culicoides brevitarsis]|uniref:myosin-11-like n=1 Tax=Culicoides brevitarsis TaxID=469753 RepID=UPI00307B8B46